MSAINNSQSFPLPQVAEALKPFIKTRQEVLHIRRVLSLYFASHIEGLPNGDLSPISLATPGSQVRVKRIPPELTGVRRDYLLALQAHIKAKEKYALLTKQIENLSILDSQDDLLKSDHDTSAAVSTYLDLFEARQKHEKLRILQSYVDLLAKKDAAQPEYLTLASVNNEVGPAPEPTFTPETNKSGSASHDANIQALTTRLEKALLQANRGLQRQRILLAEAKEKYQNTTTCEPSGDAKIHALTRTRDELVTWLEEQLAKVNETEDNSKPEAPSSPAEETIDIEQRKVAIQKLYKDYLDIRKSLISLASKPRTVQSLENINMNEGEERNTPEPSQPEPISEASILLPYLTEHLIPAFDAQTALFHEQTHISRAASHQTKATDRMLQKLADESYLLANHPIPSTKPRSQNTITEPKLLPSSPFGVISGTKGEADIVEKARAWAFAANAARTAQNEAIGRKLRGGEEHAAAAKSTLGEMENLLGGDVEGEEGGEEDIWIEGKGRKESRRRGEGVWTGVDGSIGIGKGRA
jgi:hypothetical protein